MPILVQRTSRRRQWLGVAVMAVVILVGLWLVRPAPMPALPESPSASTGSSAAGSNDARSFNDAATNAASVANPNGAPAVAAPDAGSARVSAALPASSAAEAVPTGLTETQWKELQAVLKDHPNRDAEIARVTDFVDFQARLQRFMQLSAAPTTALNPDTRDLARTLLEQLPLRLTNGEVSGNEVQTLADQLLATLHPDPVEYERERAALRARLGPLLPAPR